MVENSTNEFLRAEKVRIAQGIYNEAFLNAGGDIYESAITPNPREDISLLFEGRDKKSNDGIYIYLRLNTPAAIKFFSPNLHGLTYPYLYITNSIENNRERTVSSPYGAIPSRVIDSAGRYFIIDNEYFLQFDGRGTRYEIIEDQTESDEYQSSPLPEVPHVDFQIAECQRDVDFEGGDIEILSHILNKLKRGEYTRGYGRLNKDVLKDIRESRYLNE